MIYKIYNEDDISSFQIDDEKIISVSTGSPYANNIDFFTGIRSIGKIKSLLLTEPLIFDLKKDVEIKYAFKFDKNTIPGSDIEVNRNTGVFLSSADQNYYNDLSFIDHQSIYNYTKGYLYRNIQSLSESLTSFSTNIPISVNRNIAISNSIFGDSIKPKTVKIEMNASNISTTGAINSGAMTALTTALDLKNPSSDNNGVGFSSFFGVPWREGSSLDTATSGITVEFIFRPFNENSILMYRRLSSSAWAGSTVENENSFIKLEIVKNSDGSKNAIRFYIRTSNEESESFSNFAPINNQASGLFVPEDVGINIYDGKFHHIVVTWGVSGLGNNTTIESGAGAVLGYIDGLKIMNREETNPRLHGADNAGGPIIQANMFEQKFPIKLNNIEYTDPEDNSPSGNNLYFGVSNFNRSKNDTTGERGALADMNDPALQGKFDGQIQHIRIWNKRFLDNTNLLRDNINRFVDKNSEIGRTFDDFRSESLTGSSLSSNLIGWWEFNELSTATANDISGNSNTGQIIGHGKVRLYDTKDITKKIINDSINDSAISSYDRIFLYSDTPLTEKFDNNLSIGNITRIAPDDSIINVGTIFYDIGMIIFDADDSNARLNFLYPTSGTTGDFGFSVLGSNNTSINVERIKFNSVNIKGRLLLNTKLDGEEFNNTENRTGINKTTNQSIFDKPHTYITTIGLHNDIGDLLAVCKISKPIRKDEIKTINLQNILDF